MFISAVSSDLRSTRLVVKKALEDAGYHAVEQQNFQLDHRDVVEKLHNLLRGCHAVVHIAGPCYGTEPLNRPSTEPQRSFTQLEYHIASEVLKIPIYRILTADGFPTDEYEDEDLERQELQDAHHELLTSIDKDYLRANSKEDIDRKVRTLRIESEWLRQQWEASEQAKQRAEDEREEAARENARKLGEVWRGYAERFLHQLVSDPTLSPEDARRRAIKELPGMVERPLAEVLDLIDQKLPLSPAELPSPVQEAQAALAHGDYDSVFRIADLLRQQGRELAMLEGTAALAKFRESPSSEWNERALAAFQRAMALADRDSETEWRAWAEAAISAASVLKDVARYPDAEPLLRDCLRIHEPKSGPESQEVSLILNNLASLLYETNRAGKAEPLHRRALAIDERSLGPDHPNVSIRLNNLAELLRATNRAGEAEPLYRRALATTERSLGPGHPTVAASLNNLAELLRATNRAGKAEPLFRRAVCILARFGRATGHMHPNFIAGMNNYVRLLVQLGVSQADLPSRLLAAIQEDGALVSIELEVERLLGPARSVEGVLTALDGQYRKEGRPWVWFLPLGEPVAPHLDELLGRAGSVDEVLAALDEQYRREGKPSIWFLPLDEPIAPHLDELLGGA